MVTFAPDLCSVPSVDWFIRFSNLVLIDFLLITRVQYYTFRRIAQFLWEPKLLQLEITKTNSAQLLWALCSWPAMCFKHPKMKSKKLPGTRQTKSIHHLKIVTSIVCLVPVGFLLSSMAFLQHVARAHSERGI